MSIFFSAFPIWKSKGYEEILGEYEDPHHKPGNKNMFMSRFVLKFEINFLGNMMKKYAEIWSGRESSEFFQVLKLQEI